MGSLLLLIVTGNAIWWARDRRTATPASPIGTALHPTEARLLAAAAREPANPKPYVSLAEEYAAVSRSASALWAYGEAAARAPQGAAIRLQMAAALIRLGYPGPAETMLQELSAQPIASSSGTEANSNLPEALTGELAVRARLEWADLLLLTGRPTAALAALTRVGAQGEVARGRCHEAMGNVPAARKAYRSAGQAGDPDGFERLARLELAEGRIAAAQEAVRSLGALRAGRTEDLLLIASIHAADGSTKGLDAALGALLRLAQKQPRDAEAFFQAGLVFHRKGERRSALDQFERAVKLDGNHIEARGRLAALLDAVGQTARAHRERAAYYALKDQPDRSLAELQRAGDAGYADDLERTLMAARAASELQQLPKAVRLAEDGLKRHPGDPNLLLQLGLLHQLGGSRLSLEKLCRDWSERDPASGLPYWLQGRLAVGETRIEDAIRFFEIACEKQPERADFCAALGIAYLAMPTPENYARARTWLEKAIALNPRSASAHQHLGRVLDQADDLEGARRQYLLALDVQPRQTGVLNHVVQVSTRLGRPEAARLFAELARDEEERTRQRQRLSRQVRDHPNAAASRLELARFLIREGRLAPARNHLERAAESGSPEARRHFAQVERLLRVQ